MSSDRKDRMAKINYWEEFFALRDLQREQRKNGLQVIKESNSRSKTTARG